jgi:PIN like domain
LPLRFFVDENMLAVGYALAAVREDVVHPGHVRLPDVPKGTLDTDWLPVIGSAGYNLVVFTRDKRIQRKAGEAIALRDHGVRMFVLTGKRDLTSWEKLELLVRSWSRIEKSVASNGVGPWVKRVTAAGVRDLVLW